MFCLKIKICLQSLVDFADWALELLTQLTISRQLGHNSRVKWKFKIYLIIVNEKS